MAADGRDLLLNKIAARVSGTFLEVIDTEISPDLTAQAILNV